MEKSIQSNAKTVLSIRGRWNPSTETMERWISCCLGMVAGGMFPQNKQLIGFRKKTDVEL
jgi:hypothetical protein